MNFISRLMPREGRFFNLFDNHAKLIVDGALALADVLRNYDNQKDREAGIKLIEDAEHAADRITHETVQLLHTTFVTPVRPRRHPSPDLAHGRRARSHPGHRRIAGAVRHPEDHAAKPRSSPSCCGAAAERVQSAVGLMASMADAPAILKICQEIDRLESEADKVMRGAISKLFRNETDVRQLIKLKAVYESLESATDKCQDVANVIESVVLENA